MECQINADYKREFVNAGPDRDLIKLAEDGRLAWLQFYEAPKENKPVVKHDKSKRIDDFIRDHHGKEVSLEELKSALQASQGTVYNYVRDMPLSFRRVGTSRWRVTDPVTARAEAVALTQDRSNDPAAISMTTPTVSGILAPLDRRPSKP